MNVAAIRAKDPAVLSGMIENNGSKHAAWTFRLTPLMAEFIRGAAALRIDEDGTTRRVDAKEGALVDSSFGRPEHAPARAGDYEGDPSKAMWYPSLKMATIVADFNRVALGKEAQYIAFVHPDTGKPLPEKNAPPVRFVGPDVFEVKATFLGKTMNPALPQGPVTHAKGPILFADHGRRLEHLGKGRFRLTYHPTAVRWLRLSAYNMGDATHRFEEVLVTVSVPKANQGGEQAITFPAVGTVSRAELPLQLKATSSADLPVRFTVEYGPAVVDEEGRLKLAEVPAKASWPLRIAVTAYQFGSYVEPRVQQAEPVTQVITVQEE
jgi:hypothetical protein